jgi:hypothetical protein
MQVDSYFLRIWNSLQRNSHCPSRDSQDLVEESHDIFPQQVIDHYGGKEPEHDIPGDIISNFLRHRPAQLALLPSERRDLYQFCADLMRRRQRCQGLSVRFSETIHSPAFVRLNV